MLEYLSSIELSLVCQSPLNHPRQWKQVTHLDGYNTGNRWQHRPLPCFELSSHWPTLTIPFKIWIRVAYDQSHLIFSFTAEQSYQVPVPHPIVGFRVEGRENRLYVLLVTAEEWRLNFCDRGYVSMTLIRDHCGLEGYLV